jgi:hypothetical protein
LFFATYQATADKVLGEIFDKYRREGRLRGRPFQNRVD